MSLPSLSFVGLGTMGAPMCRRLLAAGYAVHAYDVDGAAIERAVSDGEKPAVDRVEPVLEHLGHVFRCGQLGNGNVVTNQLWFVHTAALAEGFALGLANGVDLDTLWRAIKESVADSFVARHDAPSIFAGHYQTTVRASSRGAHRGRNTSDARRYVDRLAVIRD